MTQLDDISGHISGPSQIYNCEFCVDVVPPIATLSELNEHLKSAHIDLVFHCETCDNFIDRNSLIEHMMQHLRDQVIEEEVPQEDNESNKMDEEVPQENNESKEKNEESDDTSPKTRRNLLKEASGSNVKYLKKCHYCPKLFSNR